MTLTTGRSRGRATADSPSTRILVELEHARDHCLDSCDVAPVIARFRPVAKYAAARRLLTRILEEGSLGACHDLRVLFTVTEWDDASPVIASATSAMRRGSDDRRYLIAHSVSGSPRTIGTLLQWMCEHFDESLYRLAREQLYDPRVTVERLRTVLARAPIEPLVLLMLLESPATFYDAHFVAELVWHFCPRFATKGDRQFGRGAVWLLLNSAPPSDVPALLVAYAAYDESIAERYVYRMGLSRRQAITRDEWSLVLTWPDPHARLGKLRHAAVTAMGFSLSG